MRGCKGKETGEESVRRGVWGQEKAKGKVETFVEGRKKRGSKSGKELQERRMQRKKREAAAEGKQKNLGNYTT